MPHRSEQLVCDYLSLTPGPLWREEKLYSWELPLEFQGYSYETVSEVILSYPDMRLTHCAEPDWSHFAALWQSGNRRIALDFMPDTDQFGWETGQPHWTGCNLKCDCLVGDLVDLWMAIRQTCPGVWLYDAGTDPKGSLVLSPEGFLRMPNIA